MLIRFYEEGDKQKVIRLWQEAFSESEREILPFLEYINSDMLLMEEKGEIISMLSLLKVKIGGKSGRYVYAVATGRRFRGMGHASALLAHAKKLTFDAGEEFLVILPQKESLYAFYEKSGFTPLYCAKRLCGRIGAEALHKVEKITAEEYAESKKTYFSGEKYVEWDIKTLDFMKKVYRGEFLKAERDGKTGGIAFCHKAGDRLVIHELLADNYETQIIDAFGRFSGAAAFDCIKAEREGDRFGMICPPCNDFVYFGLGMQ